jgi:RRXRR protein
MSPQHTVPVIGQDGKPLTPTTPARARKLVRAGQARPYWTKLNTYAIRMIVPTRKNTPRCGVGVDHGHAHEGYAVVCGQENVLAIKLDLPDKCKIARKLDARRRLRRARRSRQCRRRPARFDNRRRQADWIAPSQRVLVLARVKMLDTLCSLYPLTVAGVEEVRFDHRKRWGATFSTVEIGKARLRRWYEDNGINASYYQGWETKALREEYGYTKCADKGADRFSAHCTDALALACAACVKGPVAPGPWLIVDETYRPVRRRLHDTQATKGGVRAPYSRGSVHGLRKGLLIGTGQGTRGKLCGVYGSAYRYYDRDGKRKSAKSVAWISSNYWTRTGVRA